MPQRANELRRDGTGDAVATIDDNLERIADGNRYVLGHPPDVLGGNVHRLEIAASRFEFARHRSRPQSGDAVAEQRFTGNHDLQAVVLRWIVTSRHHHSASGFEIMGGVIKHRCRHLADIDDITAGGANTLNERFGELRTRSAPVSTDGDGLLLERSCFTA